jgi:hypothetical protein
VRVFPLLWAEFSHPELTATSAGIILAGIGTGLGIGYNNFKVRKAKADAEAFRIEEEARKGSTLAALDDLTTEMKAMQCRLGERDAEILRLRAEIDDCHADAEKLRGVVLEFSMGILHRRGYVVLPGGSSDEIPVPPQPQPPSESHEPPVPPGPDRGG